MIASLIGYMLVGVLAAGGWLCTGAAAFTLADVGSDEDLRYGRGMLVVGAFLTVVSLAGAFSL